MKLQNLLPVFGLVILFPLTDLSANQSFDAVTCNQTIYLEGNHGRKAVYLTSETEVLEVCGLTAGQAYTFSAIDDGGRHPILRNNFFPKNQTDKLVLIPKNDCVEIEVSLRSKRGLCSAHFWLSYSTKKKVKEEHNDLNKVLPPISVIGGVAPEVLIEDIFIGGGCFEVSNVTLNGNVNAAGIFSGGMASLGIDEGVILSSGNVVDAAGPNNDGSVSTDWGGQPGDADLNQLQTNNGQIPDTEDRIAIEFDFTPTVDMIQFNYTFGSDEYCQWIGSSFTDVFGFFISGPGINGGFTLNAENVAVLPTTGESVSINTVNNVNNSGFFVPNRLGAGVDGCGGFTSDDIEYDGWTTVLTATANVQACETYHIKLVLADNGDGSLDSGVFLEANSFSAGVQAEGTAVSASNGTNIVFEQCADGSFIFTRAPGSPLDVDIVITYTIGGTATPGADYDPLPMSVTILAGQVSVSLPVTVIPDMIIEGQETIILTLDNPCECSGINVEMIIEEIEPLEATLMDVEICGASGSVTLSPTVIGGNGTFTYMWDTGDTGPSITVMPTVPTTYIVTVTDDCNLTDTASATVILSMEPTAEIDGIYSLCDGVPAPTVDIPVTFSGTGPWTFTYTIGGIPQPPITTSDNPYTLTVVLTEEVVLTGVTTGSSGTCIGTVMGSVTTTLIMINASINSTPEMCVGADDGTIMVTASGGINPYSYNWSNGAPDAPTQMGVPAGSYSVIVTDADGCTAIASVSVDAALPLTANLSSVSANCTNNGGGDITLTVGGGNPAYTYMWSDGSSGPNLPNAPAGPYIVTVTDANGCTAEATTTVDDNTTPPDAVANGMGVIDCNNEEMQIDGNGSSTAPDITYQWSGPGIVSGGTTLMPTINAGGTYTILVTDSNSGCTAESMVDILEDVTLPDAVANLGPFDCATSTLELDGNGSNTGLEFTYQWSGPSITSGGTTLSPTIDQAGTYTILVTNTVNGCTNEASVSPNPPTELTANLSSMEANCTNNGGGNITLTVGGGTPTYTYAWSDGSSGSNLSNAPAGSYTVIVTDLNGCTAEAMVDVDDNTTPPDAVANGMGVIDCDNKEIQIDGNGSSTGSDITYQWSGPGIVSGGTTLMPTINAGGTYTIVVTDNDSGCTAEAMVDITEDIMPPDAFATGGELDCNNVSIIVDGIGSSQGGGITYQWSGPGVVSGGTTLTPTVDQAGTYTILVTNTNNGCTAEAPTTIIDNSIDPIATATFTNLTCTLTEVNLNGNGSSTGPGITYQWTGPSIVFGETTLMPTIDGPGSYTLVVTNGSNGCTAEVTVNIMENITPPIVVIQPPGDLGCVVTEIVLNSSGSSTGPTIVYNWNGPSIVSGGGSFNPTIDESGTYTLIITNTANGCTAEASVDVIENIQLPVVVIAPPPVIDCNNPTITIDGTGSTDDGGTTYQWTGGSGSPLPNGTNPTVDVGATGVYILVVTNSLGCSESDGIIVTDNLNYPNADAGPTQSLTCTETTVFLDGIGSDLGPNITYQWFNENGLPVPNGNGVSISTDQTGTYELVVTETGSGCSTSSFVTVDENLNVPISNIFPPDDLTCVVDEVVLNVIITNATNVSAVWSTTDGVIISDGNTLMPTVGGVGVYVVILTDEDSGCTAVTTTEVMIDDTPPNAVIQDPPVLGCTPMVVSLDGTLSTFNNTTSYFWTGNIVGNQGTLVPLIIDPGFYTLTVTNDINGCTAEATVEVIQEIIEPDIVIADPELLNCFNSEITLDATGSDAENGTTYQWLDDAENEINGATDLIYTITEGGTFTFVVTTSTGCTNEMTVTVDEDLTNPSADAGQNQMITCTESMVTLDGSNSSTGSQYEYAWINGIGDVVSDEISFVTEEAGTYELIVTNLQNGCTANAFVMVNTNADVPTVLIDAPQDLDCIFTEFTLNATTNDNNIVIQWTTFNGDILNGENTLTPTIGMPGTYEIVITDNASGCTAVASAIVEESIELPTVSIAMPADLDCNAPTTILDGSMSSNNGNYQYDWTTFGGNILSGQNTLEIEIDAGGFYTLTILNLDNGCESFETVEVDDNTLFPMVEIDEPEMITCSVNEVEIFANNSSTGSNLTYEWTTTGGTIVDNGTTLNPTVGSAGTYTLVISNGQNGCIATASIDVEADANIPQADAGIASLLDCITNEITLAGTAMGGTNLTYQWTTPNGNILNGDDTLMPMIDAPGTYILNVENPDNNCQTTSQVIIEEDTEIPTVDAGATATLNCSNPIINLDGTGSSNDAGLTILWTTGDGNILNGANTLIPEVDGNGTYTLTIFNPTNNCSATEDVVIDENFVTPTAVAGPSQTMGCGTTDLELNGATSSTNNPFLETTWITGDGNIVMDEMTLNPTIDAPGTYILNVLDPINGCTATASVDIFQNTDTPEISIGTDGAITCTTTNIDLEATVVGNTANYVYEWTTGDGNIASGSSTLTPNVDAAGMYQLLVTDTVNNCMDMATLIVTEDANIPQAMIESAGSLSCNSASVTLDASNSTTGAGITYEWTTDTGNFTDGQTTLSPTIDAPGLYTLTVMDANNNCINSTGITVEVDTLAPTVIPQADGVLTCEIEEINLDGSNSTTGGDLTYLWTTDDGTIISGGAGLNPLIGAPGTYTLTIINNENGCDNSADLLVEASAEVPIIAIEIPEEINCLIDSISIDATNSDNGATYEIEWTTTDGNIVSFVSPLEPVVDASGTYNLLITNTLTGCSTTQSVLVLENTTPPIAETGQTDEVNCYTPTIDLNGDGSSVGAEFIYAWTTVDGNITANANSLTPTIDSEGVYQILVTNTENGCTTIAAVAIDENFTEPNANAGPDDELSCATELLELNGGNSTTDPNTTIVWTTMNGNFVDNTNTLNPTVDQPGTYILELLNIESGCNSISEVAVTQDILIPMVEISPAALLTCNLEEFTLDGTDSDNGPTFVYEWTTTDGNILSGDSTLMPNIDEGGTYVLTVTNIQNECSATANITIDEDTTLPIADAGATQELTCVVENVFLEGENSSTGMDFIYEWSTTGGMILSGGATLTPNVAADGIYQLLVTDETNGCTAIAAVEITEDTTLPEALIADSEILNCYQDTLILNAETSSQGPDFIYEWSTTTGNIVNGGNTLTPSIDEVGFYQILVSNTNNGCTNMFFTQVADNFETPTADAGPNFELSCTIDNVTLDGGLSTSNPEVSFEWISPNGNFLSGQNSLEPNVNATGIYTLVITNTESGCSAISEVEVTQDDDLPNADAGTADALTCNVLSVDLDGSNSDTGTGFIFEWSTQNGSFETGQNTLTPMVNGAGVYVLTITNEANDCSTVSSVTVPSNTTPPLADAGAGEELSCIVEELSLDGGSSASGIDFSYEWSTMNGSILNGETTLTPNIDSPGTYEIVVTDLITGCTATDAVEITESLDVPVAAVADPAELTCAELMVDLDGNPSTQGMNIIYIWSTMDGNIVDGENTLTPTVNEPGTYEIIVTDGDNGCTNSSTIIVIQNIDAPNAEAGEADDLDCETDVISLNGEGSTTGTEVMYEWSTTNGNIAGGENTLTPTVTAVGEYFLEVMDMDNGCASMDMVTVDSDEDLPLTVIANPAELTCADEVVVLNGENSDNGPNFVFEWSTPNGNILSDINAMNSEVDEAGNYTLVITNTINGCTESASVAVGEDVEEPMAEAGETFTLDCLEDIEFLNGSANGNGASISTDWTTSNGLLQSGTNTLSPGISQAGVYTLTVTNLENGCSTSDNVLVETDGLTSSSFVENPVCYDRPGIIAFQNIEGGAPPYVYSIDGGNTFADSGFFPNLPAGSYDLVIQDANGCEAIETVEIIQPEEVIVQVTIDDATIQLGEDFQITAQTTIPDSEIDTIVWTPNNTLSCGDCLTPIATPDFATVYSVVVTDHNGCSGEDALFLRVEKSREIHLPNVFSPNGDGDNDVFMIFSDDKSIKKIESFLVFNRWGETVFQHYNFDPNQPAYGWDGTHRGQDMNPAVFVWFAEVEFFDGVKKIFKGDVTLMR
ncbi:MAG: gliding motility-associated-like protein [Paraglaciecola sp.]|jgi:gliding motility-associated-like protein